MKHRLARFLAWFWTDFIGPPRPKRTRPLPPEPWDPPKRADLISSSWDGSTLMQSPTHDPPDLSPPPDARRFGGYVRFIVGPEGSGTGSGCRIRLWTFDYLEDQCRVTRLAWPHGLALTEEFVPHRTLSDLGRAIRQLCQQKSARTYEELLGQFEQYGWFEYEAKWLFIENKDRYPPLEGKLLAVSYTDFADADPEDPTHFGDTVRIKMGSAPSTDNREHYEYFRDRHGLTIGGYEAELEFLLCTPSWFKSRNDLSQPIICEHVAFTDRFDRASIEATLAEHCRDCCGFEEAEVVADMVPYARRIDR